jgi:hypothetical protein
LKTWSGHAEFVVDKVALAQALVLRFPLPIFIPPISPQSPSPIIRGWYNRPVVAAVPKAPPHQLKKKIKNCINIFWIYLPFMYTADHRVPSFLDCSHPVFCT